MNGVLRLPVPNRGRHAGPLHAPPRARAQRDGGVPSRRHLASAVHVPYKLTRFCARDPAALVWSCQRSSLWLLSRHQREPLRRCWIDHPYGEEEITRLEDAFQHQDLFATGVNVALKAAARCIAHDRGGPGHFTAASIEQASLLPRQRRWRPGQRVWRCLGPAGGARFPALAVPGCAGDPWACGGGAACARSICWPVHAAYRKAKRSGDSAAMLRIRFEVQRERAEWALARG